LRRDLTRSHRLVWAGAVPHAEKSRAQRDADDRKRRRQDRSTAVTDLTSRCLSERQEVAEIEKASAGGADALTREARGGEWFPCPHLKSSQATLPRSLVLSAGQRRRILVSQNIAVTPTFAQRRNYRTICSEVVLEKFPFLVALDR
jgi:hypothetical protein